MIFLVILLLFQICYSELIFPPGKNYVSIPIQESYTNIKVLVKVNGKNLYPFIIDTGSNGSIIDEKVANDLKLKKIGRTPITDSICKKFYPTTKCTLEIDSIKYIGKVVVASLENLNKTYALHTPYEQYYGIIGLDMLTLTGMRIDNTKKEIIFYKNGYLNLKNGIDLIEIDKKYAIKIKIDEIEGTFVLDTADSGMISIPPSFMRNNKFSNYEILYSARTCTFHDNIPTEFIKLNTISINDRIIRNAIGSIAQEEDDYGTIGLEIIKGFIATFDFSNKKILLEPIKNYDFTNTYFYHYHLGIALANKEDFENAIHEFEKSLKCYPRGIRALEYLALLCFYTEKYEEAIKYANELLKIVPDNKIAKKVIRRYKVLKYYEMLKHYERGDK